jgi:uncharacterized membrane protein YgcG
VLHRIPVPRPLRLHPDPAESADPQTRELLAELARMRIAPEPEPRFRSELRAQLVAIAPRLIEEEAATDGATSAEQATDTTSAGARHTDDRLARRGIGWRRPLAAAASVLVVLGILLGVTVWLSRSALPGDALYGLKRTSERVQLFFASSDTDRAKDYLQFAQRRADEVKSLLHRGQASAIGTRPAAAGVSSQATKLISQTLNSADSDTRTAMRLLGAQVARKKSAAALDPMKQWAPPQLQRLQGIANSAPAGAVRDRIDHSVGVIKQVWARTLALDQTAGCACTGSAGSDTLGPRPCTPCGSRSGTPGGATGSGAPTSPVAPGRTGGTAGTAGTQPRSSAGGASSVGGGGATGGGVPATTSPGAGSRTGGGGAAPGSSSSRPGLPVPVPTLPVPVPTLPLPLPSVSNPVNLNSCQVSVGAGPLHVTVTICPSPSGR